MEFDFNTFTNLMTLSPERALKYRDECHKAIKKDVKEINEEKNDIPTNNIENIEYNPDDFTEDEEDKTEFTRDDLIEKLEKAGITYVKTSKDDTLLKKCIENNLLN